MDIKSYYLSASIICSDFKNLQKDIKLIEKGGIDFIHIDIMDGHFVPRLGLNLEIIKAIKDLSSLPIDIHLMVNNPLEIIKTILKYKPEYISVHAESTPHLNYLIQEVKKNGIKAGVALNPSTHLYSLEYLLDNIDMITVMAINPGIPGHKLIPGMIKKIKDVSNYIGDRNILLQVDGGVSFESAQNMIVSGANMLVCGSSTIFNQNRPMDRQIKKLRSALNGIYV